MNGPCAYGNTQGAMNGLCKNSNIQGAMNGPCANGNIRKARNGPRSGNIREGQTDCDKQQHLDGKEWTVKRQHS
jgi:hypothetical protein